MSAISLALRTVVEGSIACSLRYIFGIPQYHESSTSAGIWCKSMTVGVTDMVEKSWSAAHNNSLVATNMLLPLVAAVIEHLGSPIFILLLLSVEANAA